MPDGPDRVRQPWAAVGEFFGVRRHREDLAVVVDDQNAGVVGCALGRGSAKGDADPQPSVRIGPSEATRSASAGITEGLSLAAKALAHTYWVAYALVGVTVVAALFSSPQGRGIASAG